MGLYGKVIDIQKLMEAWKHVKKNKPAAGVDNVTVEQFDSMEREALRELNLELQEHRYEALPIRKVTIYQGEKARDIALYCMRDKVVQQSLAYELNKMYDPHFSSQTYAYRSGCSALNAVEAITEQIRIEAYPYYLKVDISHFFDTIQWNKLESILRAQIMEDDVLELIRMNACAKQLNELSGELTERKIGIDQGSGIAPILSNIYLMEFDQWMQNVSDYYVRYSDDMILLGKNREQMSVLLKNIILELEKRGLKINEHKSMIGMLQDGVDFLGYHIDSQGKTIPAKAEENLRERLDMMWLSGGEMSFEERIKKALEIIGGWEQYFREEREIGSIIEFVSLVYASQMDIEKIDILRKQRYQLENSYKDIAQFLSEVWRKHSWKSLELLEYEQYYQLQPEFSNDNSEDILPDQNHGFQKHHEELLRIYREMMVEEHTDLATELMQSYTDIGSYGKAQYWMSKKAAMEQMNEPELLHASARNQEESHELIITKQTVDKFRKVFVGREDIYAREEYLSGSFRKSELQTLPLTDKEILGHLQGEITIDTYIQRPNGTVRYIVLDVDISKKILLKYSHEPDMYENYRRQAESKTLEICRVLHQLGVKGYIEDSGNRGYHIWLFLSEWIPVRYANMFCEVVLSKIHMSDEEGITVECFPNKTRLKPGKYGQAIKLPYGIHVKTGRRSCFLDDDCKPCMDINSFSDNIAYYSIGAVKRILAANHGMEEPENKKTVDHNLEEFGALPSGIQEILEKCNLMCYLCQKAKKTGYLTHFERQSILYVFGHVGEEGKEFVHKIMSYTLNYQYNVTEKFIRKMPEKPISCVKLRDQYKQITAEYGCSCTFKRTRNCYPSPVLHAIAFSGDLQGDVTLPVSRTLTKEKEKKVLDEINIHSKAQELAGKILELKKQKRSIDKSVHKLEQSLSEIFNQAGIECLEIEMGMLVRRKHGEDYEWVIEI